MTRTISSFRFVSCRFPMLCIFVSLRGLLILWRSGCLLSHTLRTELSSLRISEKHASYSKNFGFKLIKKSLSFIKRKKKLIIVTRLTNFCRWIEQGFTDLTTQWEQITTSCVISGGGLDRCPFVFSFQIILHLIDHSDMWTFEWRERGPFFILSRDKVQFFFYWKKKIDFHSFFIDRLVLSAGDEVRLNEIQKKKQRTS